jgi:hypothetical protein
LNEAKVVFIVYEAKEREEEQVTNETTVNQSFKQKAKGSL